MRRFTPRVDNVLAAADELAAELGHDHIGTEHLQAALARDRHGLASQVLQRLEVVDEAVTYLLAIMRSDRCNRASTERSG